MLSLGEPGFKRPANSEDEMFLAPGQGKGFAILSGLALGARFEIQIGSFIMAVSWRQKSGAT